MEGKVLTGFQDAYGKDIKGGDILFNPFWCDYWKVQFDSEKKMWMAILMDDEDDILYETSI